MDNYSDINIDNEDTIFQEYSFSQRYNAQIDVDQNNYGNKTNSMISQKSKKAIIETMKEFDEPQQVRFNRYDNWITNTSSIELAIKSANKHLGLAIIDNQEDLTNAILDDKFMNCPTPYLFDIIEFQFKELSFKEKEFFRASINRTFKKELIPFQLTDNGLIQHTTGHKVLSPEIIKQINKIDEPGLKELLNIAIRKHLQPDVSSHRDAVEKIWDAFERLKTYYATMDKKQSINKIISDISGNNIEYSDILKKEFEELTRIGNEYRIRHHETNKIDILDIRHYDYLFNRCLSLITLSIQYLK